MISNATARVADTLNRTTVAVVEGVRTVAGAVDLDSDGVAINGSAIQTAVRAAGYLAMQGASVVLLNVPMCQCGT